MNEPKVVPLPRRPVQLGLFGPPTPLGDRERDENTYLSKAEIRRLTARKYKKAQCRILAERGWKFEPDGDGHPLVLRTVHDARFGEKSIAPRRRPRLEGLSSRR